MLETDFTQAIEGLNNKIGGVKLNASKIFSLYEELEWLNLEQLRRLVETLKFEEKFPTLARINQTLSNLGIYKNNLSSLVTIECDNCGKAFCFNFNELTLESVIKCPNYFYNKCHRTYVKDELIKIIKKGSL